jgi:hypothetical protein
MRRPVNWRLFLFSCALVALPASVASAGPSVPDQGSGTPADAALSDRVGRLEARLQEVESEVDRLKHEKQEVQNELDQQRADAAAPKSGQPVASPASSRPSGMQSDTDDRSTLTIPSSAVGTRLGYQGFPFKQKEGGFFYSFFFDRRLRGETDETGKLPSGDLDFEVAVGVGRSGTDHLEATSLALLQTVKVQYQQTMLSAMPSLKYYVNEWAPYGIRPYLVGGPGIWADIVESPPLFIGQTPPARQFASRKLPVDASAGLFEGGQGGAGLDFSLARTRVPVLERFHVGFDYRYSAWTSGQRFSTYGVSLFTGL